MCLTVVPGSATTYAEVMSRVGAGLRLQDVGITGIHYRKGLTGSSILEIRARAALLGLTVWPSAYRSCSAVPT